MKGVIALLIALLVNGCASSAAQTNAKNAQVPVIPSSIITDEWCYTYEGKTEIVKGEWIHIPSNEATNLLLYIQSIN